MHNIWALFKSDIKHLFANVVSTIIVIGLVVIPSFFAWYNLLACWDVFDNTGNLKVAVANTDEGYESDFFPLKVDIGEMVTSALRANDSIDWVITDKDDAINGAASGAYYAAVVIPESFSKDMLTFYSNESKQAEITYYCNDKKNAITPKITTVGADTVSYEVNKVFAQTLSEILLSVAHSVSDYMDDSDANGRISAFANHVDSVGSDMERLSGVLALYSNVIDSSQGLLSDSVALMRDAKQQLAELAGKAGDAISGLSSLDGTIANAEQAMSSSLDASISSIADLRQAISDADVALISQAQKDAILSRLSQAQAELEAARTDYDDHLKPSLDALAKDVSTLSSNASSSLAQLNSAETTLMSSVDASDGILSRAMDAISGIQGELGSAASSMHDLSSKLLEALSLGDRESIKQLLGADVEELSKALAAPVEVKRIAVFPSENFGSAMAPFYSTLAIFIGSLLILVAVRPRVSNRALQKLDDPKPRELLLGRYLSMGCISFAQTTIMALGNILFLQVQALHPLLLILAFWVAGQVFTFFIFVLVLSFANLGKALAVCLLVAQVTGCGGTYPLQILPDFVQWVSPFLPATHSVNAMRGAMFGIYDGDYWIQLGELCLFLIPAAIIGFALRKPFVSFMKMYLKKVESTKVIS